MTAGKFITLEGGEGVGKSTQAHLLAEELARREIAATVTREPGGTEGAEEIRRLLLRTEGEGWNPRAEALLFAAARSDHVERLIRPALQDGKWVICDRFVDSSRAYQGGGGGLSDGDLMALHRVGCDGLLPDLTILIEVEPENVAARLAARDGEGADRIGGRGMAYHRRVAEAFARLAAAEPERIVRVDGNGSSRETQAHILSALTPLLRAHA